MRIELISDPNWAEDEGVSTQTLQLLSSWGPGVPVPVVAEEGRAIADREGVGWSFESVQDPALMAWGERRSFLMAVYVPRGAVALDLELEVQPSSSLTEDGPITVELDVEVPQSVIDVMYVAEQGE